MAQDLERFDPAAQLGRISYEHFHRYALCRDQVDGKRVLDLASGAGYGTIILAQNAASVVGVDIDPQAVREAQKRYKAANVEFMVADCFDLPFDDASFDAVIANEMIEHIKDHNRLIIEIRRVLRPGGMLFVSTPNKTVYNRYQPPNPFHVAEMDISEFSRLLNRHFAHVSMTGLRMGLVSVGFRMGGSHDRNNLPSALTYLGDFRDPRAPQIAADELWLHEPEYVLALCSDEPATSALTGPSLFVSRDEDLWLEHEKIMSWASGLHAEDATLRADFVRMQADLQVERDQLQHTREDYARLDDRFTELRRIADISTEAFAAHRETLSRATAEHFAMSSRLLGRMTGNTVGQDGQSVIEALFIVNQVITEQRGRIAEIAGLESRLVGAEAQKAALRQEVAHHMAQTSVIAADLDRTRQDALSISSQLASTEAAKSLALEALAAAVEAKQHSEAALSAKQADLDQAKEEVRALCSANDKSQDELASMREDAAAAFEAKQHSEAAFATKQTELDQAKEEVRALRSVNDKSQHELARMREDAAATKTDLASANARNQNLAKQLDSQFTTAPSASAVQMAKAPAVTAVNGVFSEKPPVPDKVKQDRERFAKVHHGINVQLDRAAREVSGRVAPASPQPWRFKRWVKRANPYVAPFQTVLFDANWIARQSPDIGRVTLARYLRDTTLWALDPHPVFAGAVYLETYPDVAAASVNPLQHYREHGWREARNPHPYFANDWYLAQNPDVLAAAKISPLEHYLEHGWREGRWPNPLFSPRAYLDRYPDVAAAGVEPLTHFLAHGREEGREITLPSVNPAWSSLLPAKARNMPLLDYLLKEHPTPLVGKSAPGEVVATDGRASWPPERLADHWLSQRLRDFIIEGYGEEAVHLYSYLCSVMSAFENAPEDFSQSEPCRAILERVRSLSLDRAVRLPAEPQASIIIPVYNNITDTMLCLCSILEDETSRTYEIIVADDGSNDATAQLITAVGGIVRYIRQPRNFGFLGNCNAAAKQACGKHIVLLNNDTLVMPRWLDALLETFELHEKVGLSGSKLINWDGTLQEAGGIYWKDGSAWNLGRGAEARAPEYSYFKDVDYVSGAAIAIPTDIWRELGGFDEIFAPAYCEDADLAFRLRAAGYRTVFNPQSEVLHHEGRSHGRDLTFGIKAHQVINQKMFFERWHETLQRDHFPNAENLLRARDRSAHRKHILVIDHYVPQWDQDAGSRSTFMCIQAFLKIGYAVTFWPDNLWRDPHYTPMLQQLGVEVIYGREYMNGFKEFIRSRNDFYETVFVNRPHVAQKYMDIIRSNMSAQLLYYGHDLHFKRMMAALAAGEPISEADIAETRKLEFDVCRKADVVLYPDPQEVRIVKHEVAGKRVFAAIPVFAFDATTLERGSAMVAGIRSKTNLRLLFVGGFGHTPNRDGIQWFLDTVFPELQRRFRGIHLTIAGSKPPESITCLASEAIDVLGFVTDERLARLYEEAALVIAPLRYGAGVKGKVVEAMAMGVPLVTTPIGAQGLENPDDLLFVAGDSGAFLDAVERALIDREEAQRRAECALDFVQRKYSFEVLQDLFLNLIE